MLGWNGSLCRRNHPLWLQNTSSGVMCCTRAHNTHLHESSKHTTPGSESHPPFMHFTVIFRPPGQSFLLLKKRERQNSAKAPFNLQRGNVLCCANSKWNNFHHKNQMFYSLHQRGVCVCWIHKQGLIKHDFQGPYSEKVSLRGQTETFDSSSEMITI